MSADAIIYCLERLTDYAQFERLCHDLVALEHPGLEPLGGFKDMGRDAVHVDRATGTTTIFAYSVREDWRKKLEEDAEKVRKHGHACDRLVFISPSGRRAVWSTNIQGEPARIEIADLDALDRPSMVDQAVAADEQVRAWWAGEERLLVERWSEERGAVIAVDLAADTHRTLAEGLRVSTHGMDGDRLVVGTLDRAPRRGSASGITRTAAGGVEVVVAPTGRAVERLTVSEVDLTTGASIVRWQGRPFTTVLLDSDLQPRVGLQSWSRRSTYDGQATWTWTRGYAYSLRPDGRYRWLYTLRDPEETGGKFLGVVGDDLWLLRQLDPGYTALVGVDLTTRKSRTVLQGTGPDVGWVQLTPDGEVAAVWADDERRRLWTLDPKYGAAWDALAAATGGEVTSLWRAGDRTFGWVDGPGPRAIWTFDPDSGSASRVLPSYGAADAIAWRPTEALRLTARDGLPLTAYLTRPDPEVAGPGPWPLVLVVHGGPGARDSLGYDGQVQRYADLGYAVLRVNFRGSSGFGRPFLEASVGAWGTTMQTDLLEAVDLVVAKGVADPTRVAITGASYGGYATLAALTMDARDRYACGIAGAAPGVLYGPKGRFAREEADEGDPVDIGTRAQRVAWSPLTHVDALERPVLVWHGERDQLVPEEAIEDIARAAGALGDPLTWVVGPQGHHGLYRPADAHADHVIEARFLQACMGGRAEGWDALPADADMKVPIGVERLDGLADALTTRNAQPD